MNCFKRFCIRSSNSERPTSGDKMSSEQLVVLPELILERIFSFLPVRDLKNVRLVSKRMGEAVLNLVQRFKTWKIEVSRIPLLDTDKVSRHDIKIKVYIDHIIPELDSWLIEHSSCITAISIPFGSLPQKVIASLGELRQVRKLEICDINEDVKTLLSSLGYQLESLTVEDKVRRFIDENDLSSINLSNLKHLKLIGCTRGTILSLLNIVPSTIESVQLYELYENIEFPSGMENKLQCLKNLEICNRGNRSTWQLNLPIKFLGKSLTRLYLWNVDLMDLEPVDIDLPLLKKIHLSHCKIEMRILKYAQSLTELCLEGTIITDYEDLEFSLPALTKLDVGNMINVPYNWLPKLISGCSLTLTHLRLCYLEYQSWNLACDLPALKVLIIWSERVNVNHLLSKCSTSLQFLCLNGMYEVLHVNVPSLKELHLEKCEVKGFTKLISPEESSLEILGFKDVTGSFLVDIVRCRLENLKMVYFIDMNPVEIENLKKNIITPHVEVITDERKWFQDQDSNHVFV